MKKKILLFAMLLTAVLVSSKSYSAEESTFFVEWPDKYNTKTDEELRHIEMNLVYRIQKVDKLKKSAGDDALERLRRDGEHQSKKYSYSPNLNEVYYFGASWDFDKLGFTTPREVYQVVIDRTLEKELAAVRKTIERRKRQRDIDTKQERKREPTPNIAKVISALEAEAAALRDKMAQIDQIKRDTGVYRNQQIYAGYDHLNPHNFRTLKRLEEIGIDTDDAHEVLYGDRFQNNLTAVQEKLYKERAMVQYKQPGTIEWNLIYNAFSEYSDEELTELVLKFSKQVVNILVNRTRDSHINDSPNKLRDFYYTMILNVLNNRVSTDETPIGQASRIDNEDFKRQVQTKDRNTRINAIIALNLYRMLKLNNDEKVPENFMEKQLRVINAVLFVEKIFRFNGDSLFVPYDDYRDFNGKRMSKSTTRVDIDALIKYVDELPERVRKKNLDPRQSISISCLKILK